MNIIKVTHNLILFSEHKVAPSVIKMKEPIKLLDENLEFNNSAVEFLYDQSTNYLVVGIMGK